MSSKLPEAIFKFKCVNGKPEWLYPEDIRKYCLEHEQEEILAYCKPTVETAPKLKLYAFYHVNVLQCAVIGYTAAGHSGIDTVKADYLLRALFAKDFIIDHKNEYVPIMLDKRNMTMPRLLKFVQDSIFFIESDLGIDVPESDEYKQRKLTGKNYKKVK